MNRYIKPKSFKILSSDRKMKEKKSKRVCFMFVKQNPWKKTFSSKIFFYDHIGS